MAAASTIDHQVLDIQIDELPKYFDLYHGPRDYYFKYNVPVLYRAAMEGNWKATEEILRKQPNLATARLDYFGGNVLHIAIGVNHSNYFIKQLLDKYVSAEDLATKSFYNYTPLAYAALAGNNTQVAKLMVQKNDTVLYIPDYKGYTPLCIAAIMGHQDMTRYLLSVTSLSRLTQVERSSVIGNAIIAEMYDVALALLNQFPDLALYKAENEESALHRLAKKPLTSHSTQGGLRTKSTNNNRKDEALKLVEKLWEYVIRHGTPEDIDYFASSLFDAARFGNIDVIEKIVNISPGIIWKWDEKRRNIFTIAILNRQVEVFNLIYEIGGWKMALLSFKDADGNNALHLAAVKPSDESLNIVTGAALQMQRELLWYKEVENLMSPIDRMKENNSGMTPRSLFTETHKELRKEGERWMKTTANSCSLVAALVATVAFTVALTVPGGNDQQKGIPIFQREPTFVVFAIADALSLFSSTIAILMFLGILTSRYAEEYFLKFLPLRLLIGLSTLFFSIIFMMVAFTSTFFIIFKAGLTFIFIPILISILAAIPIFIFAFVQFSLLIDIYRSTYQAKYLFKNNQRIFKAKGNSGR